MRVTKPASFVLTGMGNNELSARSTAMFFATVSLAGRMGENRAGGGTSAPQKDAVIVTSLVMQIRPWASWFPPSVPRCLGG